MWKYSRKRTEEMVYTTAKREFRLWGADCFLSFSAYSIDISGETQTAISFAFGPVQNRRSTFAMNHVLDGIKRPIEQKVVIPTINGTILELSDIGMDEDVHAARMVCDALLRSTSGIIENARLSVRRNISNSCFADAVNLLNYAYEPREYQMIRNFLGDINWALMLEKSGCDDRALGVIDNSLRDNHLTLFSVNHDGPTGIAPIVTERFVVDRRSLADLKAASLLKHVCGEEAYNEFKEKGRVTTANEGYKFILVPGQFLKVTDPNGKRADLCIHTFNFSCNPTDEVILSYQYIKHEFHWFMKTAIVHSPQSGFNMPES